MIEDGALFNLNPGENPVYAEMLDTNGRLGWRLVDKYGHGILLERGAMERLSILLELSLGRTLERTLDEVFKNHGGTHDPVQVPEPDVRQGDRSPGEAGDDDSLRDSAA